MFRIRGSACPGFCCVYVIPFPTHRNLLKTQLVLVVTAADDGAFSNTEEVFVALEKWGGGVTQGEREIPGFIQWSLLNVIKMSFFSVFIGRAEHILLEVCPLDATRTLLGPVTTCLFCQCGRCGYEGDLRLHGRPVSQSSCVYTVSSFTCFVLNLLQLVGIHLRAIVSLSGTKRPNPKASALCSFALEVKLWLHLVREQLLLRAFCVHCF